MEASNLLEAETKKCTYFGKLENRYLCKISRESSSILLMSFVDRRFWYTQSIVNSIQM